MDFLKYFLGNLINACYLIILARVLLSFVDMQRTHPATQFIYRLTEPLLAAIRNLLPRMGMLDFSPLVAFLLLSLLQRLITGV